MTNGGWKERDLRGPDPLDRSVETPLRCVCGAPGRPHVGLCPRPVRLPPLSHEDALAIARGQMALAALMRERAVSLRDQARALRVRAQQIRETEMVDIQRAVDIIRAVGADHNPAPSAGSRWELLETT